MLYLCYREINQTLIIMKTRNTTTRFMNGNIDVDGEIPNPINLLEGLPKGRIFDDAKLIDGIFQKSKHSWSETIEMFEKNIDNAIIKELDVSKITITQPNIQSNKVKKMLEEFNKTPMLNAVQFKDGKIVIYDGHHRLTSAYLLGKKKIKVNLVKL